MYARCFLEIDIRVHDKLNSPITIDDIPSIDDDQDQGSASASASASGSASENNTPKKNKGVSSAETINGSKKLKAK